MQFLRGELGVSRISDGHAGRLRALLEEHPEETYDIAACVISKQIAEVIEANPMRFIDSADSRRNAILAENKYVAENSVKLQDLPVFNPDSGPAIKEVIQSLDPDVLYRMPYGDFSMSALILLIRPEISIVPLSQTGQFGEYLRRHLYKTKSFEIDMPVIKQLRAEYKDYLLYLPKRVEPVSVDAISEADMYHGKPVIPAAYGTIKLSSHPLWAEFKTIIAQELVVSTTAGLTVNSFIKKGLVT